MGSSGGSTLGLDFSKGRVFSDEVFRSTGRTIHPLGRGRSFILIVSFSRHAFRLSEDSVAAALEAALGGSAIDLRVSHVKDKVFSFQVSCMQVGFIIMDLRSFACDLFKCYFHLWGNGGPNWVRELKIWHKECDAEWILISPTKRRSSLGLLAMHKPPVKSAFKSRSSANKKLSFATFEKYSACKGYRYPASQACIDTIVDGGYDLSAHERVVIRQPPAPGLHWTVTQPPIVFGTVNSSLELLRRPDALLVVDEPVSVDPQIVRSGNLAAQFQEAGTSLIQNKALAPGPAQFGNPQGVGLVAHDDPFTGPIQDTPSTGPSDVGLDSPAHLSPSSEPMQIPSSQEAARLFEAMVDDMVDQVLTCTDCGQKGHMAVTCGRRAVCSACSRVGHFRRDCNDFARSHGLVWRQSSLQQNTSISESSADQGKGAGVIGISSPVISSPPALLHSPIPPAKDTSGRSKETLSSSPLPPMANFELDPHRLVPPGHHIIDGGDRRLPRTFFTPAARPPRRHEDYMVAEVMPAPDGPLGPVREEVVEFLQNRGILVRSAQPWFHGVGLLQVRDPTVRYTLIQHPPFALGNDRFVRFMKHDEGDNFKGNTGFRSGWLMFVGIPLDYRTTEYISQAVGTFGKFHSWDSEDPYLVRAVVEASFPDTPLVPRDVVFGDYAEWGGAQVSWTAACYVLGADFADHMPND